VIFQVAAPAAIIAPPVQVHPVARAGQLAAPVQIAVPADRTETACPSSKQTIIAGTVLDMEDSAEALLAFTLALLKLTNTIDAKIPIIAMTIKSSIRVNPFFFFFFVFFLAIFFTCLSSLKIIFQFLIFNFVNKS
jgi:hypothetical protein